MLKDLNDERSVIEHIDRLYYRKLLDQKMISDGMLPKLHNCFRALEANVKEICIGDMTMLKPGAKLFTSITL